MQRFVEWHSVLTIFDTGVNAVASSPDNTRGMLLTAGNIRL